jgi:predicted TIM-barrel fold metal-dependent hydrolase
MRLRSDFDILDGHVHCFQRERWADLLRTLRYTGTGQFALLDIGNDGGDPQRQQLNNAIRAKRDMPNEAFVFGGLDFTDSAAASLEEQLQHLIDIGCDGMKLLIGKPDRRKKLAVPLDDESLRPMLALAERTRFPVLWHVGDPPEFWSERTVPQWARQRGWWYDATHPTTAQLDAEIASVFARHPRLNLILPHFFFLSDRLDDAATLLQRYPSFVFDLAPGVEMFHNFSARRDDARAFFVRFADRILFGADFGMTCGWGLDRGMMIRRFLETDDVFDVPEDPAMTPDDRPPLRGIALPRDALAQIYAQNFRRIVGDRPRPLAVGMTTAIQAMSSRGNLSDRGISGSKAVLETEYLGRKTPSG